MSKTVDALAAEISKALSSQALGDGLTAKEIMEACKIGEKTVQKTLRELHTSGRLAVSQRIGESITGSKIRIPVYSLKRK